MHVKTHDRLTSIGREIIACAAIVAFMSAVWVESDAYRYVALLTLVPVIIYYFWIDFLSRDTVLIGYIGLSCIAWSIYLSLRFLYDFMAHPEYGIGTSEGIYFLPALYSISGYAIFKFIQRPLIPVFVFVFISALIGLFIFDFAAVIEGRRPDTFLQQNSIHAAIAQGMIALCMLPFASYILRTNDIRNDLRIGLAAISLVVLFVGIANIYALKSKGVWLAFAFAFPFQLLLMLSMHKARRLIVTLLAFSFAVVVIVVVAAWDGLQAVAGDTARAAVELLSDIASGEDVLQSMDHAINDDSVPGSFRQRLMLWANAFLFWAENPIFGLGVTWLHDWQMRAYQGTDFNLMHNGYLEIAVRYGLIGLAFYGVLYSWSIRQFWRAKREGIIDPAAFNAYVSVFLFFCLTNLSNSNVRLAIGESYMWLSAALAFYCFYHRQRKGSVKVTTWM